MSKFKGLSTAEDLKNAWHNLTDLNENTLNVIWDFVNIDQIKNGCNIINSRYNPNNPNEIGHYCAIFKTPNLLIYHNPISGVMARTLNEMEISPEEKTEILKSMKIKETDLMKYPVDEALKKVNEQAKQKKLNTHYDLTGEQKMNSNSCGYYCLAKLYDYITNINKWLPSAGVLSYKKTATPEQLKNGWYNLTGLSSDSINIISDYSNINQLKEGCNIINSNPNNPHWCAIFKTPKMLVYYNPIFGVMLRTCWEIETNEEEKKLLTKKYNIKRIKKYPIDTGLIKTTDQVKYKNMNIYYDMTGGEKNNSFTSGFYCLARLYDYINNPMV